MKRHADDQLLSGLARGVLLGSAAFLFMAVNDDNGCGGAEAPEDGRRAACQVASDCGGDPGVDCDGGWQCLAGECSFECSSPNPRPDADVTPQPDTDVTPQPDTGPDTNPEPSTCYSDAECPRGLVCAWADDCACPSGANCLIACPGTCVEPEPGPGPACTSSASCRDGEYCTTEDGVCDSNCPPGMACPDVCWGTCEPRRPTEVCYSDAECQAGERCDRDPCVYPGEADFCAGEDCRPACGGVCAPVEQCQSDRDCRPDQYCGCGPGPGLPNGLMPCYQQCLPREQGCMSDADCGEGLLCENGQCAPARECQSNDQCPRGWTCESACGAWENDFAPDGDDANRPAPCPSVCVPPAGPTCEDGSVCGPNERCELVCWSACPACDCAPGQDCFCPPCQEDCFSTCVPIAPPVTCSSDAECAPGNVCDFSNCWGATDPAEPGDPNDPSGRPIMCLGECRQPEPPAYDCKQDSDCIDASGRTGTCEFEVCEAAAFMPCDPSGQSCDPMPPAPICYGFCNFEQPAWCNPWDPATCPDGFTCQSECDAGAPNGLIFCPSRCVPEVTPSECVVTGCSGQVCAPEDVATTCEWRPWYVCYRDAVCGAQADGSCGWQETDSFRQCMQDNGAYRR